MLTHVKLALLISAPLVAGATTYAVADANRPQHEQMMQKFDQNGDGQLDDAERAQLEAAFEAKHAARKAEMLAKFDLNKDGQLDQTERAAMHDARASRRFQAMDKNGDGQLSLDEFKAGAQKAGFHHHGRHGHGRSRSAGMKP